MSLMKLGNEQKLVAAERKVRVLELCKSGASLRAISVHLNAQGISCSKTTVGRDIKEALQKLNEEQFRGADELRRLELERLDALHLAHWANAMRGDTNATWVVLAICKRRCELLGLDAPKKAVNLNLTKEELEKLTDEELDSLIEELG